MKWIETPEGILKSIADINLAKNYQSFLDDCERGWAVVVPYDEWEEEFLDQLEWENCEEFKLMMRGTN